MSSRSHIRVGSRLAIANVALGALAITAACRDAASPEPMAPPGIPASPDADVVTTSASVSRDIPANGRRLDVLTDTAPPPRTRYGVKYHGYSVVTGYPNVYVIWYGNWNLESTDSATYHIVTDFLSTVGSTAYFTTVRMYSDAAGRTPTGALIYGGSTVDAFSRGSILSDADVEAVAQAQMYGGGLPQDPDGLYLVLGSPEATDTTGLDVTYCGRHGTTLVWGARMRYAWVGSLSRSPVRCAFQSVGPNGTLNADAMVSHIVAELVNTITDPFSDGWYDKLGLEPADKCVWNFGTTYKAPNGALANIKLGQRHFLLQQLWVPTKNGGACAMHP